MTEQNRQIYEKLREAYPDVRCELDFGTPLQLLTATVLSAQTTDKQVNRVTEVLFRDAPDLPAMRKLTVGQLEDYIRTVGFFHTKARHLIDMWQELEERFGGEVPRTREELTTLPGVGRKTANVVISNAFGVPAIAVDTHVFRVSNRIGLADAATVEETEKQLMQNLDEDVWSMMHHLLIFHGRRCCHARGPECGRCPIAEFCRKYQADTASAGSDGTE
ncbi:MAG: endonuclease III [Firmicutes bacterium]|nr:endonuclease III [Bacillota bacterium]